MKKYFIILVLGAAPAFAQPAPGEIARMLQSQSEQYAFTATVNRAWCMRLNPAAIGGMYMLNGMYNFHVSNGKVLEHEILFQNYLFNFGWRRALSTNMEYRVDQFSLSMGLGSPEFLVGGSLQWFTSDLPGNSHGVMWNIGTLMQADPHVTIALTKRNMNQPIIGGVKVRGVQSVGISVRPFGHSERLLLALEYTVANDQRLKEGSFKAGVEGNVFRNVRAYALVNRMPDGGGTTAMIGVRVYVPYFGLGISSAFDNFKTYSSSVGSVLFSPEPRGLR